MTKAKFLRHANATQIHETLVDVGEVVNIRGNLDTPMSITGGSCQVGPMGHRKIFPDQRKVDGLVGRTGLGALPFQETALAFPLQDCSCFYGW